MNINYDDTNANNSRDRDTWLAIINQMRQEQSALSTLEFVEWVDNTYEIKIVLGQLRSPDKYTVLSVQISDPTATMLLLKYADHIPKYHTVTRVSY